MERTKPRTEFALPVIGNDHGDHRPRTCSIARGCVVALMAVGLCGCGGRPPIPAEFTVSGKPLEHWLGVLRTGREPERIKAVEALSNVGNVRPEVVPALASALADAAPSVRAKAALALLKIGPEGCAAEEPLARAAENDPDADVRASAARALAAVRGGGT